MRVFLVRHAKAVSRKNEFRDAVLRPLTAQGHEQAVAIARWLAAQSISRIVSAPSVACQQTVEPLTLATGVPVEVDERIGEGETVQRFLELFPTRDLGGVVFSSHREHILALLRLFELPDAAIDAEIPCRKGSIWVVEGPGRVPASATYLEPVLRPSRRISADRPEAHESVRAAVLDLGSTSFNLLIADVDAGGAIQPVVREKVMLRLGSVIAVENLIPEEVCERAVEVARELRIVAEQEKVQKLIPVATAALRDASNGRRLADRIGRALGTEVRILSGEQEARLMFRAFQRRVKPRDALVLAIDLGGGSLELALGRGNRVDLEVTLPLGVARLHGSFVASDPMKKGERKQLRKRVRELLAPHKDALLRTRPEQTIAAGGTIRALARLLVEHRAADSARIRGPVTLAADALRSLADRLTPSTREDRLAMRGIRKARADLLPTGAVVLATLLDELDIDELTVSDWGLREGVLLDAAVPSAVRAVHEPLEA